MATIRIQNAYFRECMFLLCQSINQFAEGLVFLSTYVLLVIINGTFLGCVQLTDERTDAFSPPLCTLYNVILRISKEFSGNQGKYQNFDPSTFHINLDWFEKKN